jgi:hypothetical protein
MNDFAVKGSYWNFNLGYTLYHSHIGYILAYLTYTSACRYVFGNSYANMWTIYIFVLTILTCTKDTNVKIMSSSLVHIVFRQQLDDVLLFNKGTRSITHRTSSKHCEHNYNLADYIVNYVNDDGLEITYTWIVPGQRTAQMVWGVVYETGKPLPQHSTTSDEKHYLWYHGEKCTPAISSPDIN